MVERGNSHERCGNRKMAEHSAAVLASKEREGTQKKRELKEGMPEGITVGEVHSSSFMSPALHSRFKK